MSRKLIAYWVCQLLGWGFYLFISGFSYYLNNALSTEISLALLAIFGSGLVLTHLYRWFINRMGWLRLSPLAALIPVFLTSIVVAFLMAMLQRIFSAIIFDQGNIFAGLSFSTLVSIWLNWTVITIIWSILYFAFHFFEKSRNEEIKNLKLEAMRTEVELNNLKAQLNPHFMFNAMNSIRALVEENPDLAKDSITKLSNLLRSTLLMGRKQLVAISEELEIVRDYLKLESIRYEERLNYELDIDENYLSFLIPPLMVQTLVENAIKHGIAKLPSGGIIKISVAKENKSLIIQVENTGNLNPSKTSGTGIGLSNTNQRLELIYGDKAEFSIYEKDNKVISAIKLPLLQQIH